MKMKNKSTALMRRRMTRERQKPLNSTSILIKTLVMKLDHSGKSVRVELELKTLTVIFDSF